MAVPNASMAGREPPHMGPVDHGVAVLGDAAQRAVSQLAALAADAVQVPSRLSQAAALLTDDGRVGTTVTHSRYGRRLPSDRRYRTKRCGRP